MTARKPREAGWKVFFALAGAAITSTAHAEETSLWKYPTLGFYGTPGLVDMPSAIPMDDADFSASVGYFGDILRAGFNFQITPRVSGTFRYSLIDDFDLDNTKIRYDRSFDLRYQLVKEGTLAPAVTIGLRDFAGTGISAAEYVVATKTIGRLRATGGIGWGRLGSYNSFDNPLGILGSRFDTRPEYGTGNTGEVDFGNWFRGPAALFGGLQYQVGDSLVLTAEYSSDAYTIETRRIGFEHNSPFNFAATYRMDSGFDLTAAYLYGSYVGMLLTYTFNPKEPPAPASGRGGQGPNVVPRSAAYLGWDNLQDDGKGGMRSVGLEGAAARQLKGVGVELVSLRMQGGDTVIVHMVNQRYIGEAEGIGRAARALTAVLPSEVETIVLVPMRDSIPLSAVTLQRSDLEDLEHDLEASWKSYARASIEDATAYPLQAVSLSFSPFSYGINLYMGPTFSNPDNVFAEGGLRFEAAYEPLPGFVLSTDFRQPLLQSGSGETPEATDSKITPVRSDAGLYEGNRDFEMEALQGDYFFRPGKDLYGRVSMGYFEEMYGGFSSEVLWQPVTSPLGLGLELNYVRKRDPDDMFGFTDYETPTGYVSAYYDFNNGFLGQVDAGRYLAGDWGTTVSLTRQFSNGFAIGAYFTVTDVPFDDFGEGSFDKGISFSIPLTWLVREPSRRQYSTTVRPINGDGGARVHIASRLYEIVRGGQAAELESDWGRFWR